MADLTSLRGQAQHIVQQARHHPRTRTPGEERGLIAAYLWLAQEPNGQLILEHLAERLLMRAEGPHDEGARRLVLTIFERIATAELLLSGDID